MPRATINTHIGRDRFYTRQKECGYPGNKTVRQTDMWLLRYKPRKSVTTAGRSYPLVMGMWTLFGHQGGSTVPFGHNAGGAARIPHCKQTEAGTVCGVGRLLMVFFTHLWKMGGYCVVSKCKNRGGHGFPRDKSLRKAWMNRIRRESSWAPSKHSKVCHEHFTDEDYLQSTVFGEFSWKLNISIHVKYDGVTNFRPLNPQKAVLCR